MRTRLKVLGAAVAVCVPWLLLLAPSAAATPPSIVENPVPAAPKLILPDSIIMNEPFYLSFQVKMTGELQRMYNEPDLIKISVPPCCVVDSGDTKWQGLLNKGDRIELRLKLRVTQSCKEYFAGYVYASAYALSPISYEFRSGIRSKDFAIGLPGMPQSDTTTLGKSKIRFVDTIATYDPKGLIWPEAIRPPTRIRCCRSRRSSRAGQRLCTTPVERHCLGLPGYKECAITSW